MEFSDSELDEVLNIFKAEGLEILDTMDNNLLLLEKNPQNTEIVLQLFRDAHSIKGSSRMLGFNSIQDLMHRTEDIFGLFRDLKLRPDSENLEIIGKTIAYIKDLIEKTVEAKTEYTDGQFQDYMTNLNRIFENQEHFDTLEMSDLTTDDEYKKSILPSCKACEEHLFDLIYNYTLTRQKSDVEYVEKIVEALQNLKNISQTISIDNFENAVFKAIEIANSIISSNIKNVNDAHEYLVDLDSKISDITSIFTSFCAERRIEVGDFYENVFKKIETEKTRHKKNGTTVLDEIKLLIECIKNVGENPKLIENIEASLKRIMSVTKAGKDFKLFETIFNLFKLYKTSSKPVERDTYSGICDILDEYANLALKKRIKELPTLIQRAEIIYNIAHININEINQKTKIDTKTVDNSQDWFSNISASTIKTLRIDSAKLDMLVNEIGELIVARIKNSEQVSLARTIQNNFLDWQKSWNKLGHFIKYFDKKYLNTPSVNSEEIFQNMVSYNKQLISLYANHSNKIHSIFTGIDDLYQNMQEHEAGLNSIANELEAMVKNMRILPLATIFHLFPRMIHNIAKDKGKEIEFKIQGSEVSVDKKIIEDIKIPLMHILRNSIDHGIETPSERKALGKSETGLILVNAQHKEDKIIITIKDDGRGIDVEKIKLKAVEKGILTQEEADTLPEEQIVNLIFYPGFSTEASVTELSGRGLGLDIVYTKISQLNGRIDITSQFHQGTVVTIELPATMATIKAFIALEAGQLFAFSASSIKTVARINTIDVFTKEDINYFVYNDKVVPIFTLSQILKYENNPRNEDKYTLLIIESDSSQVGIIVQKLIGEEEILHKKLPEPFTKIKNISGITTLANGSTCLILNMTDVFNMASKKKSTQIVALNNWEKIEHNKSYNILVVDDSQTTRMLQKNIIGNQGYRVKVATSALDALNIMKNDEFDLVISDNEMPEMNGLEFVKEIRKNEKYNKLRIIVLTSNEKHIWQTKFEDAGADRYIQKSEFNQESFIKTINELLK